MKNTQAPFLTLGIVACVVVWAFNPAQAALITFSDLTTLSSGDLIPATYQPLENAYPVAGGNVDGANIGVTITWGTTNAPMAAAYSGTTDHTYSVNPSDTSGMNAYDDGNTTIQMTFSKPVTLPSFFFAYHDQPSPESPMFNGYTLPTDTTPKISFMGSYPGSTGLAWQQATGFGTTPVEKVTFSGNGAQQLQLDDMTINATPEPACVSVFSLAAFGLLARRFVRRDLA
jgi:hypothetical protein